MTQTVTQTDEREVVVAVATDEGRTVDRRSAPSGPTPTGPAGTGPRPRRAETTAGLHLRPVPVLLASSRRGLLEAELAATAAGRYSAAHLAALRAAAAVLAVRARPAGRSRRRSRPTSAWVLLTQVAPELAEWAAFFAAGAGKRAAAEAGLAGSVTTREADDLLRDAGIFLGVVEAALGVPGAPALSTG